MRIRVDFPKNLKFDCWLPRFWYLRPGRMLMAQIKAITAELNQASFPSFLSFVVRLVNTHPSPPFFTFFPPFYEQMNDQFHQISQWILKIREYLSNNYPLRCNDEPRTHSKSDVSNICQRSIKPPPFGMFLPLQMQTGDNFHLGFVINCCYGDGLSGGLWSKKRRYYGFA